MKFTVEMNANETNRSIETGTLLALINAVDDTAKPIPQTVSPAPQAVAQPAPQAVAQSAAQVAQEPQAAPQAVPTTGATYDVNQLAVAAMQLKDQGRIGELQGLLKQFGVGSLVQLSPEQLPAFAQALQGLGVKL